MAISPFQRIKVDVPQQNHYNLSHSVLTTLDIGKIVPVDWWETIPGDYFEISAEMMLKLAPMVFPVFQQMDATIHFFFVPRRIMWENFPKYLAGEDFHPPYIQGDDTTTLSVEVSSILDYLHLPLSDNIKEKLLAYPIIAYYMIVNQYYQDQNNDSFYKTVRDQLDKIIKLNGKLLPTDFFSDNNDAYEFGYAKRAWAPDYFDTALPFAQRGPAVTIPLSIANLTGDTTILQAKNYDDTDAATGALLTDLGLITDITPEFVKLLGTTTIEGAGAELTGTINQLRASIALQEFLELIARSGVRYNELIKATFNVDIGDARINRPEYLGGVKNNLVVSEVLQTSASSDTSALGEYAGHGTIVASGNRIKFMCPEHGVVMAMLSIRPAPGYMQGIHRSWQRFDYTQEYWEKFAHLGEQAILNKEVYYDNADGLNDDPFGYQQRYGEFKQIPSTASGQMRTTMDAFHLMRKFATRPALNEEFVYIQPADQKRIFAVTEEGVDSIYGHIYFDMTGNRKIPFYTDPAGLTAN